MIPIPEESDSEVTDSNVRLDKWLWAVRLFKARSMATEACRQGKVLIGRCIAKPSRAVKPGDVVDVQFSDIKRTVRVTGIIEKRVGPKLVANFAEDLTPAQEYLRQLENRRASAPNRPPGAGRPTKKERRDLEAFSSQNPELTGD